MIAERKKVEEKRKNFVVFVVIFNEPTAETPEFSGR